MSQLARSNLVALDIGAGANASCGLAWRVNGEVGERCATLPEALAVLLRRLRVAAL